MNSSPDSAALTAYPHQTLQHLFREAEKRKTRIGEILARFIKLVGIYPLHSCLRLNTGNKPRHTTQSDKLHQSIVAITHQPDGSPMHRHSL